MNCCCWRCSFCWVTARVRMIAESSSNCRIIFQLQNHLPQLQLQQLNISYNPFTVSVCKISRLKEAQVCLTWYIFRCYNMSAFNAMHFIENAREKKKEEEKKAEPFQISQLFWLFSGTLCHGSGGVNRTSHKMYLLNMQSPKHTEGWKERCFYDKTQHAYFWGMPLFQATNQHLNNS